MDSKAKEQELAPKTQAEQQLKRTRSEFERHEARLKGCTFQPEVNSKSAVLAQRHREKTQHRIQQAGFGGGSLVSLHLNTSLQGPQSNSAGRQGYHRRSGKLRDLLGDPASKDNLNAIAGMKPEGSASPFDHLYRLGKVRQQDLDKQRSQNKLLKEHSEMQKCTFKPDLSLTKSNNAFISNDVIRTRARSSRSSKDQDGSRQLFRNDSKTGGLYDRTVFWLEQKMKKLKQAKKQKENVEKAQLKF